MPLVLPLPREEGAQPAPRVCNQVLASGPEDSPKGGMGVGVGWGGMNGGEGREG